VTDLDTTKHADQRLDVVSVAAKALVWADAIGVPNKGMPPPRSFFELTADEITMLAHAVQHPDQCWWNAAGHDALRALCQYAYDQHTAAVMQDCNRSNRVVAGSDWHKLTTGKE